MQTVRNDKQEAARKRLLAALFVKAGNHGIEADELREDIAPAVIGKRISKASPRELVKLLDHVTKLYHRPAATPPESPLARGGLKGGAPEPKYYPSSRPGLVEELTDAARARWGEDFEKPLNEFVNHNRPVRTHYKFLGVAALKAVKERIKEMNAED